MLAVAVASMCVMAVIAAAYSSGGLRFSTQPALPGPESRGGGLLSIANIAEGDPSYVDATPSPDQAPDVSPTPIRASATIVSSSSNKPLSIPTTIPPRTTERQLRIFRQLWTLINDRYIYPNFNGVDWQNTLVDTEARITAGLTDEQFYLLMQDVVHALNDDHSSFLSPKQAEEEDREYQGTQSYVGIGVNLEANTDRGYLYVLQVYPDSPAEKAGLRPHDHILKINDQPAINADGARQDQLLQGVEGSQLTLTVRTPGSDERSITLTRQNVSSHNVVEVRLLPGPKRIGYLQIPTFFEEDISQRIRDGLKSLMKNGRLDGLILDIRVNGGGSYTILKASMGFFTRGLMGRLVDRNGTRTTINVDPEKIGNSQTVPLMILVGPSTASYAEVFAGALQAKGRAKLVGQNSAGNIETLRAHSFEDGSMAWIAEETFKLPNGGSWEGFGLQPNFVVEAGWDEYTVDNDLVLIEAVNALTK